MRQGSLALLQVREGRQGRGECFWNLDGPAAGVRDEAPGGWQQTLRKPTTDDVWPQALLATSVAGSQAGMDRYAVQG